VSTLSLPADDGLDRDQRLLLRAGEGDREAFEQLYDRYGAPLMRFLHGLCRDRALAEDLVQETFLRAWVAAPRWRPTGRVSTWLFQIARRRLYSRHARRRMRRDREAEAHARRGPSAQDGPDGRLARRDERARLGQAVASLSPKLRTVFVLIRLTGLGYRETAGILGLGPGTVKSRMAAAEARLRTMLGAP
jgi:RNA polymerase sigma-70 factor (ECF subfamily)